MRLRWSVACGCAKAKHVPGLGRSVGLCKCAARGGASCTAELRKGRGMVPCGGAACCCAEALHAAGLRRNVGLRRGTEVACATWGCAGAQCGTRQECSTLLQMEARWDRAGTQ